MTEIHTVAVIGTGVMGRGIAQLAAQAGYRTLIYDASGEALAAARPAIAEALERRVGKGKLDATEAEAIVAQLEPVDTLTGLAGADIAIEAVVEDLAVKHDLVRALESECSPTTLICSNTSSLSIGAIAEVAAHPGRVAGLHFFNPAPVMKLVEVVAGAATDPAAVEALVGFATALGKTPVRAADSPGFIVNRCARPYYSEALVMLEEGLADCASLDACLTSGAGTPLGPFELMDLIGLDVSFRATETIWHAFDEHPRFQPAQAVRERVEAGQLGRKSGQGFYTYPRQGGADQRQPALASADALADHLRQHLDCWVRLGDGRTAAEVAAAEGGPGLLLDQNLVDWADRPVTLACAAAGLDDTLLEEARRLAAEVGVTLVPVADRPGLVVQRVVAMLHDEARRAVAEGVATAADIDTALKGGLNYRLGPFALAEGLGEPARERILERLARQGPPGRYPQPSSAEGTTEQ